MCEECIAGVACMLGDFLEGEDVPPELAFSALHLLARMIELRTGMSLQDMNSLLHQGRELGDRLSANEGCYSPATEEEKHRSLLVDATLKHYAEKPN